MNLEGRWQTAQEYERDYWARVAEKISQEESNRLDYYEWRSHQLVELLKKFGWEYLTDGDARTLEIGAGPIGVAPYFPARERVVVDPLEGFYRTQSHLTQLRDPAVEYLPGVGEQLPFTDGNFDLVIIENCIDHVESPSLVMSEIRRVLSADGVVYLTVNCRSPWGYLVHRLLSSLRIDPGHPHTYTADRVKRDLMRAQEFEVISMNTGQFREAWLDDLCGPALRTRVKALLGVSEYVATVLATPTESAGRAIDRDKDAAHPRAV